MWKGKFSSIWPTWFRFKEIISINRLKLRLRINYQVTKQCMINCCAYEYCRNLVWKSKWVAVSMTKCICLSTITTARTFGSSTHHLTPGSVWCYLVVLLDESWWHSCCIGKATPSSITVSLQGRVLQRRITRCKLSSGFESATKHMT